jgi:hypothetical protein
VLEDSRFDFHIDAYTAPVTAHEELRTDAPEPSACSELRLEASDAYGTHSRVRVSRDDAHDVLHAIIGNGTSARDDCQENARRSVVHWSFGFDACRAFAHHVGSFE